MKTVAEWTEDDILSLPYGEFDWLEAKGRRAIDLTLPNVKEATVLANLAKEVSAFSNSGGGQLVLGLANPASGANNWMVDDGGISTMVKGKISTREWLEDIIPNLVEFPLLEFNVYQILPESSHSKIMSDKALYVIDIADSSHAPHQSARDKRYYARVAGKSQPISHRMIVDIMGRRQYPKIELEFLIEKKFIKGRSSQTERFLTVSLDSSRPPKNNTNTYTLMVRARNMGKIYAQYVNSYILIPVELLPHNDVNVFGVGRTEIIDGKEYLSFYEENTERDLTAVSGFQKEYGPARFVPILPELAHLWEIPLQRDSQNLGRDDLLIKWNTYADNAPPTSGEIMVSDIKVVDAIEPNLDAYDYDEDD